MPRKPVLTLLKFSRLRHDCPRHGLTRLKCAGTRSKVRIMSLRLDAWAFWNQAALTVDGRVVYESTADLVGFPEPRGTW
jgi:hypothetical protein